MQPAMFKLQIAAIVQVIDLNDDVVNDNCPGGTTRYWCTTPRFALFLVVDDLARTGNVVFLNVRNTPVYDGIDRCSAGIYQNVYPFLWSETDVLTVTKWRIKYSLHKCRETVFSFKF